VVTTLDPTTMKRLAFIRMLHQQGIERSRLPQPLLEQAAADIPLHRNVGDLLRMTELMAATSPGVASFRCRWRGDGCSWRV
jgi:hypothetical protein